MWRSSMIILLAGGIVAGGPILARPSAADQLAQVSTPSSDGTFENIAIAADDFVIGKAGAPVTIVEYASLTCPHCASFHNDVLPKLKESYIDTGKVRLVYRDFPLDRYALAASMLARCAGRERYFGFLHMLFRDQPRWSRAPDPMRALGQVARLGGLGANKFDSCLKDQALQTAVLQQRLDGSQKFQINSTPTLIINGRKYGGGLSFAQLQGILDPILSKS
jgi:protein-disulfide isomerase